eukprot:CAMPEP_0117083140 /NCGR_PEP_ID=MMETSP0472-20121206/58557_1 /TAXON_ID=693140 ORGANISM="Tiarina fusus, Strain LIS" /NCGR_SAMPLE_ID=MMETSP0472 /ASSEMBLY_ACC=CAM_ASM_000603 /LENGTH=40 /DNA_ID= /DNA_START= /DNA_END= /DNA_ORIENTATION=
MEQERTVTGSGEMEEMSRIMLEQYQALRTAETTTTTTTAA